MSISIKRSEEEYLYAQSYPVAVGVMVRDGELAYAELDGIKKDSSVRIDPDRLRALRDALTGVLEEVGAAQERTRPPEEETP